MLHRRGARKKRIPQLSAPARHGQREHERGGHYDWRKAAELVAADHGVKRSGARWPHAIQPSAALEAAK